MEDRRGEIPRSTGTHEGPLLVTCPDCRRTATLTQSQRNSPRFAGEHCDGSFGSRHGLSLMIGPRGEKNR